MGGPERRARKKVGFLEIIKGSHSAQISRFHSSFYTKHKAKTRSYISAVALVVLLLDKQSIFRSFYRLLLLFLFLRDTMKFSIAVAATFAAAVSARTFFETNTHYVTVDHNGNIVGGSLATAAAAVNDSGDDNNNDQGNDDNQHEVQEFVTQGFQQSSLDSSAEVSSEPPAQTVTPSSPAASPSASPSSDVSGFEKDILDAHNSRRSKHSAKALTWSDELADYAQNMADKYTCGSGLQHSGGKYGENLAVGYADAEKTVKAWYDEGSSYDYSSASTFNHFTQVIWKGSKQLGCAKKDCGGSPYVVCEYFPAGNMIGLGKQNLASN